MDFSKVKTIYMIGIKGGGMTMLAEFLAHQGYQVSGSDTEEIFFTEEVLERAQIPVHTGFAAEHLNDEFDLIIYSTAYNPESNVEVKAAFAGKVKTVPYAEALAALFNTHYGIAVCGTHGKTTTTAWLGYVLKEAGAEPNVLVGAAVPQFKGSSLVGSSNYFVAEADEYQNKLQYLNPRMIVLNNIDYDHPDFFPTLEAYEQVFADFIARLPKAGKLIANFDDPTVRRLAETHCQGKIVSYAIDSAADYTASEISFQNGKQFFKVTLNGEESAELGNFSISLGGRHSVLNALAVIAACLEMEIDLHAIRRHLETFNGTARRMQIMGHYKQALVIDDFGHHPTEIKATLEAVRQRYGDRRLRVIFHPHTFTRTKALFEEFGKSFALADEVVVLGIYGSAREAQGGVTEEEVAEEINKHAKDKAIFKHTLAEAESYLRETVQPEEVILLLGAGDVFRIGENLIKE